jgi:cell division septation protein DedD
VFHVQAGIFASERNAKILADALKRRGYTAVAEPSIDDSGKTMYRVQVGVYKSKSAASDAVLDLQRTGYPASLSTR